MLEPNFILKIVRRTAVDLQVSRKAVEVSVMFLLLWTLTCLYTSAFSLLVHSLSKANAVASPGSLGLFL